MYVKSLTLRGFKSFASTTTLEFSPGIIAIIGPNGSGKSNIVDALGWVMGEQGAKSLRGQQMADVIFAGTSSRAALGRAQVELCIDNSSGDLPIDYTEVTISRTMFRTGGSEYSINGAPCRLLDIQELLSDTGMGKNMHVIVGQGQLDDVLSADPLVRRSYIEEAAGVLKHRRRKDRALSKLDSTMDKLSRLEDLTKELRRQMGPLARQAKAAKRASVIQAVIRDAKSRLFADSIVFAREQFENGLHGRDTLHKERSALRERVDELRKKIEALDAGIGANEDGTPQTRVDVITAMWHDQSQVVSRLDGIERIARERANSLSHPLLGATVNEDAFRTMIDDAKATIAKRETESADLDKRLEQSAADKTQAEERLAELTEQRSRLERERGDRREKQARLEGERQTLESKLASSQEQLQRTERLLNEAHSRFEQASKDAAALPQVNDSASADLTKRHTELVKEHRDCDQRLQEVRAAQRQAIADQAKWSSRVETLSMSIAASDGAQDILAAGIAGVDDTFASHITIKPGWEEAVAAFFGEATSAVVARQQDSALNALRFARDNEAGKIAVVVAANLPATSDFTPLTVDVGMPLADVVFARDKKLGKTLEYLTRNGVAVDDLDQAIAVVNAHPQAVAVTRHGERVDAVSMSGGSHQESSVLSLQAKLGEAEEKVVECEKTLEKAVQDVHDLEQRLAEVERDESKAMAEIRQADAEQAKQAENAARVQAQKTLAHEEIARLEVMRKDVAARIEDEKHALDEHRVVIEEFMNTSDDDPHVQVQVMRDYEAAATALEDVRSADTALQLEKRSADERLASAKNQLRAVETQLEERRAEAQRVKEEERRRQERYAALQQVIERAVRARSIATKLYDVTTALRQQAMEERQHYMAQTQEIRHELAQLNTELEKKTDSVHQIDVTLAEQRLRVEQLEEQARQELHTEPDELVANYGPHVLVPVDDDESVPYVRAEQQDRLAQAEARLARLGTINPLAMEEHKALEERYEFMTTQINDVKKSRNDLLHIIDEVDEHVKVAFEEAFKDTAESFEKVFSQLFPGGQGRLILTDPDSPLTTGVDIEARPAGKKVKRLSLLSGGERSLAALAFLIALFKARPSPFYILDEVEAALDDVNLSRVLQVFKELRQISQLLIITHQKRTMAIADALYGVSMRDGVTSVVSHKLDH